VSGVPASAHVIQCTTSWPEVEQIIERVVSVISLLLHGVPLSSVYAHKRAVIGAHKDSRRRLGLTHVALVSSGGCTSERAMIRSPRTGSNIIMHWRGAWPSPGTFPVSPDCQHNPIHQFRPGFQLRGKDGTALQNSTHRTIPSISIF
jgi:hypothetical protein